MINMEDVGLCIHRYSPAEQWILNNINLEVKKDEFVSVIGPNGAGKSSLLKLIAQEVKPSKGLAEFSYTPEDIGIIFQDPRHGTWEDLTVEENIRLSLYRRQDLKLDIPMRLKDFQLDLETKMNLPVHSLSGGQRQALNLLMATISHPKVLLLDEHTSALDPKTALAVMEMTAKICKNLGITTVMITHNLQFAAKYATRILVVRDGQITHDVSCQTTEKELYDLF